jgi:hypothetical protein
VAVSYDYSFRLPIERLAGVQEQHAAQCETLGISRCRIVGMTYQALSNRTISATLALKLAPDIARQFGKKGIDAVVSQGGMLAEARIDSEEVGAAMAAVDSEADAIAKERKEIADQLAKAGLGAAERAQLQARLAPLRDTERQGQATKAGAALKLASTPMNFGYESGDVDPGFSDGPILGAIKDGWANIIGGVAVLLVLLISLAPWVATLLFLLWLWRRFGHRLGLRSEQPAE